MSYQLKFTRLYKPSRVSLTIIGLLSIQNVNFYCTIIMVYVVFWGVCTIAIVLCDPSSQDYISLPMFLQQLGLLSIQNVNFYCTIIMVYVVFWGVCTIAIVLCDPSSQDYISLPMFLQQLGLLSIQNVNFYCTIIMVYVYSTLGCMYHCNCSL